MLNRVLVAGRLTRDPELRYTGNNIPVASFSIAVDRDIKSKDGDKVTDFFDCVAWRNSGEFVSKYFSKGRVIIVDGRLQSRKWEDKDGNKRTSIEIIVDSAYFGDSKRDGDERAEQKSSNGVAVDTSERIDKPSGVFVEVDEDDGELPF